MNDITLEFLKTNSLPVREAKTYFEEHFDNTSCAVIFNDLENEQTTENRRALLRLLDNIARTEKHTVIMLHQFHLHSGLAERLSNNEDPKVRKNLYILLGRVRSSEHYELLKKAFLDEGTLFVMESITDSLILYLDEQDDAKDLLQEKLRKLTEKNNVHVEKISNSINRALLPKSKRELKKISPSLKGTYSLLISCPNTKITLRELTDNRISCRVHDEGDYLVMAEGISDLSVISRCRTFYEFMIIADTVSDRSDISKKLNVKRIQAVAADLFRLNDDKLTYYVDVKGYSIDNSKRLQIQKKTVSALSGTGFVNDVSSYDMEIRIIHSQGSYIITIIPNRSNDTRFSWRTISISASMHPAVAGSICYALRSMFRKDHLVIDPFCGAGTLIIERSLYPHLDIHASDVSKTALEACRENMTNRNEKCKVFLHDATKPFSDTYDEVLANLPFGLRVSNHDSNRFLYHDFYSNLKMMLKRNGLAFIFTNDKKLFSLQLDEDLSLIGSIKFSAGGLYPTLFILRKN